jgi:hypothetical protein
METEHDWNDKIMCVVEKLRKSHPELIKYIDEMPITIPDESDPDINIGVLKEFYESLINLEKAAASESATHIH